MVSLRDHPLNKTKPSATFESRPCSTSTCHFLKLTAKSHLPKKLTAKSHPPFPFTRKKATCHFDFTRKQKAASPCSNVHSSPYLKPCFHRSLSRWFRYFRAPCLVQLFYFFASMNIGYFHPFFIFQVFVYNVWFFNFGLSNYGSVIYLCAFQCFYFDYKMIRKYQWDFTKLTWCSQ